MSDQYFHGGGSQGVSYPYPPRTSDEIRLTLILERIERRLTAIEQRLDEFSKDCEK